MELLSGNEILCGDIGSGGGSVDGGGNGEEAHVSYSCNFIFLG